MNPRPDKLQKANMQRLAGNAELLNLIRCTNLATWCSALERDDSCKRMGYELQAEEYLRDEIAMMFRLTFGRSWDDVRYKISMDAKYSGSADR